MTTVANQTNSDTTLQPRAFTGSTIGDATAVPVTEAVLNPRGQMWIDVQPVDDGEEVRLTFNDGRGVRFAVDLGVEAVDALFAALEPMFEQRAVNWATTWQRMKNPHHYLEH